MHIPSLSRRHRAGLLARLCAAALMSSALTLAPAVGQAAAQTQPIELHLDKNGSLNLSALKGKVVYLDFWASWCGPCRLSFPWMAAMQQRYGEQGLVIVAVNVDKDREAAQKFLQQFNPGLQVVYDGEGTLAEHMKVATMPSSFFFDRHGKQVLTHSGFRTTDQRDLEDEIRSLLN